MNYIVIAKSIILIVAINGLILIVKEKTSIKTEFASILTFSILISTLFIFGILNMLLYWVVATVLISGGSILYLLLKKRLFYLLKDLFTNAGFIASLIIFILVSFKLQSVKLIAIDNFTHWALIVKDILYSNQISSNITDVVTFITYPPGSALFIYYGCKIIGFSEPNMLVMQLLLLVACMQCIFAFVDKKYYLIILTVLMCFTLVLIPNHIENLLVDMLLGIVGAAACLIIMYYRKDIKKASLFAMPILITIVLIKNSGIFFLAVNVALLIYFEFKYGTKKDRIREINLFFIILTLLASIFVIFVWHRHVNFIHANEYAPHTMTTSNLSYQFAQKSTQNLIDIALLFLRELFSWSRTTTKIWAIINFGLVASIIVMKLTRREIRTLIKWSIYINVAIICYALGVYGMYLFSMPLEGSLKLASFGRYMNTIMVYSYIIAYVIILDQTKAVTAKIKYLLSVAVLSMLVLSNISYGSNWFRTPNYEDAIAVKLEKFRDNNDSFYDTRKYLVYSSEFRDSLHLWYLIRYKFYAPNVEVITQLPEKETFTKLLDGHNFLFVLNEDPEIVDALSEYVQKDDYEGIYSVRGDILNK